MKQILSFRNKTILVTGAAGFIGAHLILRILSDSVKEGNAEGLRIVGIDNMNAYYDPGLKKYRLLQILKAAETAGSCEWHFLCGDISDKGFLEGVFSAWEPQIVVNLAAQAGVRYSIENPDAYMASNIVGFYNILEACRRQQEKQNCRLEHLVYASSSSVYGGNKKVPFSVEDRVDHPASLYAATKKSNELFAHVYSDLYRIPTTGLRFFTVYGPAGRPDMFYYKATEKLIRGEIIEIYNYGNCQRDFTYIDDIVEGMLRVIGNAPCDTKGQDGRSGSAPYAIYNIGGGNPVNLLEFVSVLQDELMHAKILPTDYDFEAHRKLVPMQPGDVPLTYADAEALQMEFGFTPRIGIREGLRAFAQWYHAYTKKREDR